MKKNFKKWLIASLIRAIRTFAEVMLATIGTNYVRFNEVDWIGALSIGLTAFILTIIAAITTVTIIIIAIIIMQLLMITK